MIIAPLALFMFLFPEQIIRLWSAMYLPGAPILRVFAIWLFVIILGNTRMTQLTGVGLIKIVSVVSLIGAVTNIVLNAIFIPNSLFGVQLLGMKATGAAYATLVSGLLTTALVFYFSIKRTRIKFSRNILVHIFTIALIAYPVFYIGTLFDSWRYYHLLLMGGVTLLFYVLMLTILQEFRQSDWDRFLNAIHPGEMMRYVVSELRGNGKKV